jgi:serine/threonine-protein kinase
MIGEKLGRYHLIEEIGPGSMGTVYRAEDPSAGRIVAVKLIRSNVLYDAARRERFLLALLVASQIHHPGICPILEIGDDEDDFFIVMPLLQGETLGEHMKRKHLPWRYTLEMGIKIGAALGAVHDAGSVHRALKPSNVWIQSDGEVVLMDCGIARFTELDPAGDEASAQPRQEFADTIIPMSALAYMSPEQVRGGQVDQRSDIFSLGAILYELLSDRHPFEARNSLSRISAILESNPALLTSKRQSLPTGLDAVLRKALERDPEKRYHAVPQLISACRVFLEEGRESDAFPGPAVTKSGKHSPLLRILGFSALVVLVVTFTLRFLLSK